MDKFIPFEKLSKRKKRELLAKKRRTWAMNPVTRKPESPKAYKRPDAKARERNDDTSAGVPSCFIRFRRAF